MIEYFNKNICANCPRGEKCCCKRHGCAFLPQDFALQESMDSEHKERILRENLDKGYISIDFADMEYTQLENNYFYLRMRHVEAPIVDVDSTGGICCKLLENGCYFSDEERPTGGRTLIPDENGNCKKTYTISQIAKQWQPYQEILIKLLHDYENQCFL